MKPSVNRFGTLSVMPQRDFGLESGDRRSVPRRIQVTDNTLSLVAKGFGELEGKKLPAGIYQVRVESVKKPFEKMVFLPPKGNVSVAYPTNPEEPLPSCAPVPGSGGMHEFIREPLDKILLRKTSRSKPCRIVVMVTQPEGGLPIKLNGFRLQDEKGHVISDLADESLFSFPKEGGPSAATTWKIFSIDVSPGGIVLVAPENTLGIEGFVSQPLWCSRNWSTVVFMGASSGLPLLSTISIYLWKIGASFAPEQHYTLREQYETPYILRSQKATELALQSLINGRSLLSMDEVDSNLLVEKFNNPMLGIFGCHLLLQRTPKNQDLIRTVLSNLKKLVPQHPDVVALEIMSRLIGLGDAKQPLQNVHWPPMLRRGYVAMRDKDWQSPGFIVKQSMCDRIRTRVLTGGVWTRWITPDTGEKSKFASRSVRARFTNPLKGKTKTLAGDAEEISRRTGAFEHTSQQILSYAIQLRKAGRAEIKPDDLEWTGMSQLQVKKTLRYFREKDFFGAKRRIQKNARSSVVRAIQAKIRQLQSELEGLLSATAVRTSFAKRRSTGVAVGKRRRLAVAARKHPGRSRRRKAKVAGSAKVNKQD